MRHVLLLCVLAYIVQSFFSCFSVDRAGNIEGWWNAGAGEQDNIFEFVTRVCSNDCHSASDFLDNKIDSLQPPKSQWKPTELGEKAQRKDTKDSQEIKKKKALKATKYKLQQLSPRIQQSTLKTGVACLEQGEAMITLVSYGNLLPACTKIRERGAGEKGKYKNNQNEVDIRFGYHTNCPLIVFGHKPKMNILPVFINGCSLRCVDSTWPTVSIYLLSMLKFSEATKIAQGRITIGNEKNVVNLAEAAGKMWSVVKLV